MHIQNLEKDTVAIILKQRFNSGCYKSLVDFIERTSLGIEQITILIRVGALRFTGKNKKTLLWEAHLLQKRMFRTVAAGNALFTEPVRDFELPEFSTEIFKDAMDEIELLGFQLCPVFEMVDADLGNLWQQEICICMLEKQSIC